MLDHTEKQVPQVEVDPAQSDSEVGTPPPASPDQAGELSSLTSSMSEGLGNRMTGRRQEEAPDELSVPPAHSTQAPEPMGPLYIEVSGPSEPPPGPSVVSIQFQPRRDNSAPFLVPLHMEPQVLLNVADDEEDDSSSDESLPPDQLEGLAHHSGAGKKRMREADEPHQQSVKTFKEAWNKGNLREGVCSGNLPCRYAPHRTAGHYARGHSTLSSSTRASLLWSLFMTITSTLGTVSRHCLPCKDQFKIFSTPRIGQFLAHVQANHGYLLGTTDKMPVLLNNLNILKAMNQHFKLQCPIRGCNTAFNSFMESYIHHTLQHRGISTNRIMVCGHCLSPLGNQTLELHSQLAGGSHNRCDKGKTFPTLTAHFAYDLATKPLRALASFEPGLRTIFLAAVYTHSALTSWVTSVPLLIREHSSLNLNMPQVMDPFYQVFHNLTTPQSMLDWLLDQVLNMKKTITRLDSNSPMSQEEQDRVGYTLRFGYFCRSLNSLLIEGQELKQGNSWMKEILGLIPQQTEEARRTYCSSCQDDANHRESPMKCFSRTQDRSLGAVYLNMAIPSLINIEGGIVISSTNLFCLAPEGGWQQLGTPVAGTAYNTVCTPIGNMLSLQSGPLVSIADDYFSGVARILRLARPDRAVPVVLEFFLVSVPNSSNMKITPTPVSIYREVSSFLHHVQAFHRELPNLWILGPMPPTYPQISSFEYKKRVLVYMQANVILSKLCAKLHIAYIPTMGYIESLPTFPQGGGSQPEEFYSAALESTLGQDEPTRNLNGTGSRQFRERFSKLMAKVEEANRFAAENMRIWRERQLTLQASRDWCRVDPTYPEENLY